MLEIYTMTMFPVLLYQPLMQVEKLGLPLWMLSMIGKPER
jgi:hypothetical protein